MALVELVVLVGVESLGDIGGGGMGGFGGIGGDEGGGGNVRLHAVCQSTATASPEPRTVASHLGLPQQLKSCLMPAIKVVRKAASE